MVAQWALPMALQSVQLWLAEQSGLEWEPASAPGWAAQWAERKEHHLVECLAGHLVACLAAHLAQR